MKLNFKKASKLIGRNIILKLMKQTIITLVVCSINMDIFTGVKFCNLYVKINLHGASSIKTDSCKLVDDNFSEMNIFKATVIL